MRIAYLTETYPPEINGVALSVERLVHGLRGRGHDVMLLRPRQRREPALDDALEWRSAGLPIPMYPALRFGVATVGAVERRLARWRPELLHLATPGPLAWAGLAAARARGIAVASDFRTNFHTYSRHYGLGACAPLVLRALRRLHNATDATFVPTRRLADELTGAGFDRLHVLGRGVDTERFAPARRSQALRASWGAGPADPVLLYVGRIAPEKNVALALATFEAMRAGLANLRMVVVGDGPLVAALAAAHPQARFVGTLRGEALAAAYASADVFVFPSLSETFGNVTLEALASGLAVVAFDAAAAAEHIEHGRSGWLVARGDAEGFVAATRQLLHDAPLRAACGRAAAAAARHARWDDVLLRFEQTIGAVLDARAAGPTRAALAA